MSLTDTKIRTARPSEKPYRLFDGGGLYLEVAPSGGKWWRFKYRYARKEKRLSLGVYPAVNLKTARGRRDAVRRQLAEGIDPGVSRKSEKYAKAEGVENSFEAIAREWHSKHAPGWAASHSEKILRRLERDLFPWIGSRPIAEITPQELLKALRRIESRGVLETAHRAHQNAGQVFRFGIATGRAENDPAASLRGALPPWQPKHYPSITKPKEVGDLLRAIDAYSGGLVVRVALRLAPLVFVRPGELRGAAWSEFDFEKAEWRIP
ncbi:MAG: tyrosine-type recombinase/integrase, partial [Nevskiales bacterium]